MSKPFKSTSLIIPDEPLPANIVSVKLFKKSVSIENSKSSVEFMLPNE